MAARRMRTFLFLSPAAVASRSAISINAKMRECSKIRSAGLAKAASSAGTAALLPIRPSASAAARRLCGEALFSVASNRGSAARSRHRLTECSAA